MFVREFAVAETHNSHQGNGNVPVSGRNAGKHPGNLLSVGERKDHLVHELVFVHGTRDWGEFGIWWHVGNKVTRIKFAQSIFAAPAGHHRYVVDVSIVNRSE